MDYVWYFLKIALYPIAAILVCGFVVWGCERLFVKLLGRGGFKAVLISSIIGTPVHELGHALMCLVFGHKVKKMVLWQSRSADGTLGYVQHTYNNRNLYQRLGNLFIGTGPIFSGVAVLSLLLFFAFPGTWNAYFSSATALVGANASVGSILSSGLRIIPNMIAEFSNKSVSVWLRIPAVLAMLSVSLHINLSPADIKGSASAFPPYLVIALLVTVVTLLIGTTGPVLEALQVYNAFMTAMFTVVLAFALAQVVLALVIRLILSILGK